MSAAVFSAFVCVSDVLAWKLFALPVQCAMKKPAAAVLKSAKGKKPVTTDAEVKKAVKSGPLNSQLATWEKGVSLRGPHGQRQGEGREVGQTGFLKEPSSRTSSTCTRIRPKISRSGSIGRT